MKLEEVIKFCKEEEIRQKEAGKKVEALGCDATDFWRAQILWYQMYNWLSELNTKREIVVSQKKIIRNLYSKLEKERTKRIAI